MADEPTPDPAPDGTLDQRVSSLETGQQTLTEKIDELLGIVKSDREPTTTADPPPAPDITEQVRQAIRDVNAEQPPPAKAPEPEKPPREAGQPHRDRLHSVLFGKEGKRS